MTQIVIVEDEASIRRLYQTKFEQEGFSVALAEDGRSGLRVIKETKPDIVLLDIRMPHMSGDEMLAHMRATEWGASIRVVILTNLSRDEAPAALRFLGVDRYVVKAHHTPSQIVSIVREILNIRP